MVEWLFMEFVIEIFICLNLIEIISWKMTWKNGFAGKCPNEMAKSEDVRMLDGTSAITFSNITLSVDCRATHIAKIVGFGW